MQTNRHSLQSSTGYRQILSTDSSNQSSNGCISFSSDSPYIDCPSIDGKMNESKYSKVIFSEISESYATDADIECRFYIGDAVKPSEDDKIGLFKLGWANPLENEVTKKVSECQTDNEFGERKVNFNASELPKNTEEFFQFCYLTASDDICGASTPFRFVRPHDEDLIQLDNNKNSDEEDFVVVSIALHLMSATNAEPAPRLSSLRVLAFPIICKINVLLNRYVFKAINSLLNTKFNDTSIHFLCFKS